MVCGLLRWDCKVCCRMMVGVVGSILVYLLVVFWIVRW